MICKSKKQYDQVQKKLPYIPTFWKEGYETPDNILQNSHLVLISPEEKLLV